MRQKEGGRERGEKERGEKRGRQRKGRKGRERGDVVYVLMFLSHHLVKILVKLG